MSFVITKNDVKYLKANEPSPFARLVKERTPKEKRIDLLMGAAKGYRSKGDISSAEKLELEAEEIKKAGDDGVMVISKGGRVK